MVSRTRLVVLLAVLLLWPAAVAAQEFTVDVKVKNAEVNPAEQEAARMKIAVRNTGQETRTFTINYNVANPGWYFLPNYTVTVPPGETRTSILYAEPEKEAVEGNIGVIITVSADGETVTRRPAYRIVRDRDIIITGIETDRTAYDPSDRVNVSLSVKNVRNQDLNANAYQAVFTLDGKRQTVAIPSLIASEPETLETSFVLGQYASGVKTLSAAVERIDGNVQARQTANIRIKEAEKVVKESERSSGLLTAEGRLWVQNKGNTPAESTSLSTALPFYLHYFSTFTPEPSDVQRSGGERVYTWDTGSLAPGDTATVRYRTNYWAPLLLVALLLGSIGFAVREYRKPHVVKRVYRKDGTNAVHLRVENRSGRHLENVVVKDFIPSICSLVEKFDGRVPEKIRKGGEMTELEWRLGALEPGEERILTYHISSQVAVEGEAMLPSAHLQYEANGRQRKRHSQPARAEVR